MKDDDTEDFPEFTIGRDMGAEHERMEAQRNLEQDWQLWGPYLSERQWGTVREDYSPGGTAWEHFSHDMSRSRAYRWGEDGIAGFSDRNQRLCLSVALWNERDAILKERLFGLTNAEGNHGEDVKELYYYLDAAPSHSYLRMLYKYPHAAFPYGELVAGNARRGVHAREFELLDTGAFDDDRYFDVCIEYAQAAPDDILLRVTAINRGADAASLHMIAQCWARNTWSWGGTARAAQFRTKDAQSVELDVSESRRYHLYVEPGTELMFCDNETNVRRLYGDNAASGYFKDAFHEYIVHSKHDAINPEQTGSKLAARVRQLIPADGEGTLRVRLSRTETSDPFAEFDRLFEARRSELDEYYHTLQKEISDADSRNVQRQAFAGMVWTKQFYYFDVRKWLEGDRHPPPAQRKLGRNREWVHLNNADIISMPDKWEYPWYAAWDLAFHCIPLALTDPEFAKHQLDLLTREWYMHPNGQLPAYEWAFGDVNPPVHAWATWRVFQIERAARGDEGDLAFLERVFHKLLLNFTWWVNRKDAGGRNIFQGGFLGLDNIGVFDRSSALPTGGHLSQADGTSWMAMYCLNMMRISIELALNNYVYEGIATKFFEHFLNIADAMNNIGEQGIGLWDPNDEFFYDVLNLPDSTMVPLKVRSMVGLIPLFAVETIEPETLERLPRFARRLRWFLKHRPDLARLVSRWEDEGKGKRRLLSLLRAHRMKAVLRRMLDETEFLSDHGVRAMSRHHLDQPYVFDCCGQRVEVGYQSSESTTSLFGGNSNWRGPVWFPVNFLIIESLQKFHHFYGDEFKVECPTGSGHYMTLNEVADELSKRLSRIFLQDERGQRAVYAGDEKHSHDEHFKDNLLFYEYFDGDNGRGVGASHQTGWTGLIAKLLTPRKPAR